MIWQFILTVLPCLRVCREHVLRYNLRRGKIGCYFELAEYGANHSVCIGFEGQRNNITPGVVTH